MRPRNKILLVVIITIGALFTLGIGAGLYLMNQYPLLGNIFNDNPLAALEAASGIALNQVTSTPSKSFNLEDADRDYSGIVEFPDDLLELETAEQIIEWSVAHQSQPWIENITEFLRESQVPIGDTTLHLIFINTKSGGSPVMTVTYLSSYNVLTLEKGWEERIIYNSYTCLVTEEFAVDTLKKYEDSKTVMKAIIRNYDGSVKLIKE